MCIFLRKKPKLKENSKSDSKSENMKTNNFSFESNNSVIPPKKNPRIKITRSFKSSESKDLNLSLSKTQPQKQDENEKWIKLEIKEYEIYEILLAKRKRPDEELKHSFKAIRKGVDREVKEKYLKETQLNKIDSNKFKEIFDEKILEGNKIWIGNYMLSNITKEAVSELKKCKALVEHMENYILNSFILDEIETNVLKKNDC